MEGSCTHKLETVVSGFGERRKKAMVVISKRRRKRGNGKDLGRQLNLQMCREVRSVRSGSVPLLHMVHGVHMDHKPLELPGLGSNGKPHLRPEKEIKISHK